MVDRLNTPFDLVDRILLQDFSQPMGLLEGGGSTSNYFKFFYENGAVLEEYRDKSRFFLDSFTYTPFIDYSQTQYGQDERKEVAGAGIYSDQFLNDFNCGRYEESYSGIGEKKVQFDRNRHQISSSLFELRNLQKDIDDIKESFRDSIQVKTDAKAYIYTFCEHVAELFAKLSNIRMSCIAYGFKQPHAQWEGILALDIWYQLLYLAIDAQYPFKDEYVDRNPMSKLKVKEDDLGKYVDYLGRKIYKQSHGNGIVWYDSENGVDSGDGYAWIWDKSIWDDISNSAASIRSSRSSNVTPRGVLGKIYGIVQSMRGKKSIVCDCSDGDFGWFFQKGNNYVGDGKSDFTKHVNLHLGRAYEVMSPQDYKEFIDNAATSKPSG